MLANPEADWERPDATLRFDRSELESRIGPFEAPIELLGGGRANLNVRLGDRVVRLHRRDPGGAARERALLSRGFRSFRVPRVLGGGDDFLLLEYVPLRPLPDDAVHGRAVGLALAEIHATRYASAGHFGGASLEVVEPIEDFPFALAEHAVQCLGQHALAPQVRRAFEARLDRLRAAVGTPALLHGDFKASNLHLAEDGSLLVLDWEFAYAGPTLMDFGQLARWGPSPAFLAAAADAYGGLPRDWQRLAQLLDLVNLSALLSTAPEGSRRASDLVRRIRRTLEDEGCV